ncbi:MAG TPA: 23S rRNA pseudouridine(2604) synthase RluF [Flavipsychrobacter sp.]|nr:23S rRNA pseudouridine(2604) synthase RluF [Flavipsychrobacter sp.]
MSKYYTSKPKPKQHDDSISLNKYISDTGFCSRREADDYIEQGRVTINDEPAEKGNRVYAGDVVEIDGEPIKKKKQTIYIAFNKPDGITCTTDEKDKTNIISYINHKERIFPVGRLDKDSEGLIFLTNDGNIVNKILRAGNEHEKEYLVTVDKIITPDFVKKMSEGVRILRTKTKPCKVVQEGKYVFRITLTQGMNRQIRRMCNELEYRVKKLIRIRVMNVTLGKLPTGHWRYLLPEEIAVINKMVSGSINTEEASRKKKQTPTSAAKPQAQQEDASLEKYLQDYEQQQQKKRKNKNFKDFRKNKKS